MDPPQPPSQGTSWLELFIIFELLGGKLTHFSADGLPLPVDGPGKPLKMCLVFFKQQLRLVVDTCLDMSDRCLFVASKCSFPRLSSACYTNFVACISAHVLFPAVAADKLLLALLSCRFALTGPKRTAIEHSLLFLEHFKLFSNLTPSGGVTCVWIPLYLTRWDLSRSILVVPLPLLPTVLPLSASIVKHVIRPLSPDSSPCIALGNGSLSIVEFVHFPRRASNGIVSVAYIGMLVISMPISASLALLGLGANLKLEVDFSPQLQATHPIPLSMGSDASLLLQAAHLVKERGKHIPWLHMTPISLQFLRSVAYALLPCC